MMWQSEVISAWNVGVSWWNHIVKYGMVYQNHIYIISHIKVCYFFKMGYYGILLWLMTDIFHDVGTVGLSSGVYEWPMWSRTPHKWQFSIAMLNYQMVSPFLFKISHTNRPELMSISLNRCGISKSLPTVFTVFRCCPVSTKFLK
jgi:hypothetical protein